MIPGNRSTTYETRESGLARQNICKLKAIRSCLICAMEASLLLFFCVGLAVLVEFVVIHPRAPKCDIFSVTLSNFSSTSLGPYASIANGSTSSDSSIGRNGSTSSPTLTAVIVVTVSARNQIKHIGTFYDYVQVLVSYDGDVVGEDWVGPFFQGKSKTDLLHTRIEAHNRPVSHKTGTQMLTDIGDRSVDLEINIHALTRVNILKYITHHFRVHVRCDITVSPMSEFGQPSQLLAKKCKEKSHWLSNH